MLRYQAICIALLNICDFSGNKCDLEETRQISKVEAVELGSCFQIIEYVETSAKDNTNIESSFQKIASILVDNYTCGKLIADDMHDTAFALGYSRKSKPVGQMCSC